MQRQIYYQQVDQRGRFARFEILKVNHNGVVDEHVLNDTSINAERYLYFYHIIEDFDKYISVVDNTMRPAFVLEEGKTFTTVY